MSGRSLAEGEGSSTLVREISLRRAAAVNGGGVGVVNGSVSGRSTPSSVGGGAPPPASPRPTLNGHALAPAALPSPTATYGEGEVKMLAELGFEREAARSALQASGGDVEKAAGILAERLSNVSQQSAGAPAPSPRTPLRGESRKSVVRSERV